MSALEQDVEARTWELYCALQTGMAMGAKRISYQDMLDKTRHGAAPDTTEEDKIAAMAAAVKARHQQAMR